jgi:hypothetical protein
MNRREKLAGAGSGRLAASWLPLSPTAGGKIETEVRTRTAPANGVQYAKVLSPGPAKRENRAVCNGFLAKRMMGFEPTTFCMARKRRRVTADASTRQRRSVPRLAGDSPSLTW